MSKPILEGGAIVLGIFLVFLVQNSTLSSTSAFLLAILIIFSAIYITLKRRSNAYHKLFSGASIELFGVTAIIMFIISLTNGLASPLFFFIFFMLFALAFLSETTTVLVFLLAVLLFFVPDVMKKPDMDTLIKLGSLLLLSPIAYFIGREFDRREKLSQKIEAKTEEIIQDAENLKEAGFTDPGEAEALEEIIEEAESLKRESDV